MNFITDNGKEIELYHDSPVGDGMKGILLNGELISWDTSSVDGKPHHDEVDEDAIRDLQMANYSSAINEISVSGSAVLESSENILRMFSEYKPSTIIDVGIGLRGYDIDFLFRGTIAQFKTHFRSHPPPYSDDYEDGEKDVDFISDYETWAYSTWSDKKTPEISGRGGRGDIWQEKDEDWSKSFSVYNNPPEKIHSVSDDQLDYLRSGMRDLSLFEEAFEGAEDNGISATELANSGKYFGKVQPIILHVDHKGKIYLHDGRHRYTAAQKYGAKSILATVVYYSPRGGVISKKTYIVGIKK